MNARQQEAAKAAKKALKNGTELCQTIRNLHRLRFSNQEIIDLGFNRGTVYRQVGEFEREKAEKQSHPAGKNTRKH